MLIVANGAFKSGSTWMRDLVALMMDFEPIPPAYQHPGLPHWIDPEALSKFLEEADYHQYNYLTKSHLFSRAFVDLLASRDGVYVLDISRDIRDVIVSHYYHLLREGKIRKGFVPYYWTIGRLKAHQLYLYRQAWNGAADNVYLSSFEALKTDFEGEVRRIASFLGISLSDDRLRWMREETSIERLRQKRGEAHRDEVDRFFRKGEIGDWKNHMNDRIVKDVKRIEARGAGPCGRAAYQVVFPTRLTIQSLGKSCTQRLAQMKAVAK